MDRTKPLESSIREAFKRGFKAFWYLVCAVPVYLFVDVLSTYHAASAVLPVEDLLAGVVSGRAAAALAGATAWTTALAFSFYEISLADYDRLKEKRTVKSGAAFVWLTDYLLDVAVIMSRTQARYAALAATLSAALAAQLGGAWGAGVLSWLAGNLALWLSLGIAFVVSVTLLFVINAMISEFMDSLWAWPEALEWYSRNLLAATVATPLRLPFALLWDFGGKWAWSTIVAWWKARSTRQSGGSPPAQRRSTTAADPSYSGGASGPPAFAVTPPGRAGLNRWAILGVGMFLGLATFFYFVGI